MKIEIAFENDSFLVVNKPYGLTVNRSETTINQETLQDWTENKFKIPHFAKAARGKQNSKFKIDVDSEFINRSGIVHRLDKDTSGLVIIAKNPQSFLQLQAQFKERVVKKTYLALVWGELKSEGEVQAPITRNPFNRKKFGVFIGGKEALTSYKPVKTVIYENEAFTLIEVNPLTGRTHQIRVHMAYINHPIAGDILYSGRKLYRKGFKIFNRLMLHAFKLKFINVKNNLPIEVVTEIPIEFKDMYEINTTSKNK
ncbi:MAG: RluA family pseudouridine synthase [Patescibacteria group bacterium]|nr:RluA family pseudouridine synthase [Patescibacteria group bacterium]